MFWILTGKPVKQLSFAPVVWQVYLHHHWLNQLAHALCALLKNLQVLIALVSH